MKLSTMNMAFAFCNYRKDFHRAVIVDFAVFVFNFSSSHKAKRRVRVMGVGITI